MISRKQGIAERNEGKHKAYKDKCRNNGILTEQRLKCEVTSSTQATVGRETQIRVLECDRPEISYYYTCIYHFGKAGREKEKM